MKKFRYDIIDLDCASCAKKVEDEINKNEHIKNCIVNFGTSKVTLESDLDNPLDTIKKIAELVEPDCTIQEETNSIKKDNKQTNFEIIRLAIGIIFGVIGLFNLVSYIPNISENIAKISSNIILIVAYLILMFRTIKKAYKQLKGKIIDENTLIVISCIGAYLVGKREEGLMVILLFEIGKILEGMAISKSRKSIKELMDIKPEYANLKIDDDGCTKEVNPEEVKIGETIIVKQGEKVPLDGIVISGEAELNTSALTGETKLYKVKENQEILSGSINVDGLIEVKVTQEYQNSTVSRILELVEKATDRKAKTENFVSKAAQIYTPIVIIIAILVAVFMPILIKNVTYIQSIYRALIFLVIACPCSIAISVPLAYFSGIGKASKDGILVKGSDFLDSLKYIKSIVFDKTGTITTGNFEVTKIVANDDISENKLLEYFAKGEKFSNHPIAKSILKKYEKEPFTEDVSNLDEISGKGIKYYIGKDLIKIGNKEFTNSNLNLKEDIGTIIYLSINDEFKGYVQLEDVPRKESKNAITVLKNLGIKTYMFTGDNKEIAEKIGTEVGIENIKAKMLPEDKFAELEKLLNKSGKVAFVGDGINDAPVLARADVGISMGGIGAASSIEASDVVIMTDDISQISKGIKISKKTNKIIKQNLIFSISVKILILLLSCLGLADMWQAVFADVGTTLITIFNTLRILK